MFTVEMKDDIVLMSAQGDLEYDEVEELEDTVVQNIGNGNCKFILDCEKIRFLSSMDIGIIVRSYNLSKKAGGDFKLARQSSFVKKLIAKTALDGLFPDHKTIDDAIRSFNPVKKRPTLKYTRSKITADDIE